MKARTSIYFFSTLLILGCTGSPTQQANYCNDDRTLLDGVCVREVIADYVSCVRAQGATLDETRKNLLSVEVGYLGVNASGASEISNSLGKKYSASDKATMRIIQRCDELVGITSNENNNKIKDEFINVSNFSNIFTDYSVSDFYEQTTPGLAHNASLTGVKGLRIVDNKWIYDRGFGKGPLLSTHPLSPSAPSVYTIYVESDNLSYSVRPHNKGDSLVEFWVGSNLIYSEVISDKTWTNRRIKLPKGTKKVTLKHYATGWMFEYLYWSAIS